MIKIESIIFSFMVMMNIYEVGGVRRWLQVEYVREVLNLTIPDDTRESVLFFKNKTIHSKDYEYISYRM